MDTPDQPLTEEQAARLACLRLVAPLTRRSPFSGGSNPFDLIVLAEYVMEGATLEEVREAVEHVRTISLVPDPPEAEAEEGTE